MLVKLIEVYSKNTYASNADGKVEEFSLREVFVNPAHCLHERERQSKNKIV